MFTNGSQIKAIPTSEDAGRSEALSLLVVDECVTGDTLISIRDSETGEEFQIAIEHFFALLQEEKNTKYNVLTPDKWSKFDGIKRSIRNNLITLKFNDESEITTTQEHRILSDNNEFVYVKDIHIGFVTSTNKIVIDTKQSLNDQYVYDLINVEKQNQYYTNNVVSHNCAWVRDFGSIWTGLYPTLSTGGDAILISTPNGTVGVGAPYYHLWTEAESGQNDFNPIRLPWDVHPEHDQKWFDKEVRQLGGPGSKKVKQELLCDFLATGDTYLQPADLDWVQASIAEPIAKTGYNNHCWVWKNPELMKRYIISADVARGDGSDYSAFHILDVESNELVAEFMAKMPPDRFAEHLGEWGTKYNNALLAVELNTYGYMTNVKLRDMGYSPLYYSKNRGDLFSTTYKPNDEIPGFSTQQKIRIQMLSKLEELIRNRNITIHSRRLYEQLNTFVWNNGKAQASHDSHDDLVMSVAIGVWLMNSETKVDVDESALLYAIANATCKQTNEQKSNLLSSVNQIQPLVNPNLGVLRFGPRRTYDQSYVTRQRPGLAGMFDKFNRDLIK